MSRLLPLTLLLGFGALVAGQEAAGDGPFHWRHELGDGELRIIVDIPAQHYLYLDTTKVAVADAGGKALTAASVPPTIEHVVAGVKDQVYTTGSQVWKFPLAGTAASYAVRLEYQGCRDEPYICFMPEKAEWSVAATGQAGAREAAPAPSGFVGDWRTAAAKFQVADSLSGYTGRQDFLDFLDRSGKGKAAGSGWFDNLQQHGLLLALALALLGGLALNLTPCVLPMIPVNLAIIGAGTQAGSRRQGFLLGGVYGLGITAAYGLLGVVVVLTKSTFGALNSSPWFNFAIAAVFAALALAMFDVVTIDFSRFQRSGPTGVAGRGRYVVALLMGGVAALLAGACVAPVVIAVLLYATTHHAAGNPLGLLLPFALGLGMALPWPFAGAGLGLLPRPGAWMVRVKQFFGVLILGLAVYYGHLGYTLSPWAGKPSFPKPGTAVNAVWRDDLSRALDEAAAAGRPVVIDFWASWCKNCIAMEQTTFREEAVQARLHHFVAVKFRAEVPSDPETRAVLEHFGVLGLPTYVVLVPKKTK